MFKLPKVGFAISEEVKNVAMVVIWFELEYSRIVKKDTCQSSFGLNRANMLSIGIHWINLHRIVLYPYYFIYKMYVINATVCNGFNSELKT